jgi:hypothetical protein
MAAILEVGGRRFKEVTETTARHDMYTMRQIAACGLNVVNQVEDETDEQFMYRLYKTALQTGDIFKLLGSLLLPEGTEPLQWTEELSAQSAGFFSNLTAPEDKAKIRFLLASGLMPFFVGGLRSSLTSRKSSPLPESDRPHITSAAQPTTAISA